MSSIYAIIHKKRDGEELSRAEIDQLIQGYAGGGIPDYQMAALLMAIYFRGLSARETADLTDAMIASGDTIDLDALPGVAVDKHSTGGVGDALCWGPREARGRPRPPAGCGTPGASAAGIPAVPVRRGASGRRRDTGTLDAPQGIVLDLDGVLIDSEAWSWQAHNEVLAHYDAEPLSLPEVQRLIGLDAEDEWAMLITMRRLPVGWATYAAAQRTAFVAIRERSLAPMPGVQDLLDAVAGSMLRLGLASNSPRPSIIQALDGLNIRARFQAIVSVDDVAAGKPAPDVYLRALRELALPAQVAVAVEDSAIGVAAARAAGLFCIAVPNALTAAQDLRLAHLRLESLRDVAAWVRARTAQS
ncbi:MAG TPA: HAD-IA family hydrolase [Chloroflexota bacterium]|nr:HAD-IA family hydrolase [Chloroflexota bacterium]